MKRSTLPRELVNFVVRHVDSVELLEVLLLLHKQPTREWTPGDIDTIIRSNSASIEKRLKKLIELGLATQFGISSTNFRYYPQSIEREKVLNLLAQAYEGRRVEIIELIYTKPMKEIVSFSDAFKINRGA